MSRKSASPRKAAQIGRIAALSRDLLKVQFEVLRPHIIVFTTGSSYDSFLKEQLGHAYTTLPGLKPKHFWSFAVDAPDVRAWRVRHPRRLTKDIKNALFDAVGAVAEETRPQ